MRNWRATLIAAVAIPTSVISTYTLMQMMGFTLNQITMLSLVLMVGIVIDDAIVVLENIFKNLEERNLDPVEAAIEGTREIGLAVLATTLSLVIVFLPVALMSGIVGKFMSSFGYTAAFAIMVSLLVSFTLTPMLCSRFLKKTEHKEGSSSKDTWLYKVLDRPYAAMLRWSMRNRWVIVAVAVLVLISTGPIFMAIGKDFLPKDDQSEFEVTVRLPPGSSLEGSAKVFEQIEEELRGLPGVAHLLTTIGADSRQQVDRGSVIVELVPVEKRKEDQFAIMDLARARLQKFRDLTIGVQPPAVIQGAGSTKEFQFFIQGTDLKRLEEYSNKIMAGLAALPGVVDLESSYEAGKPELRVRINRDKASDLNVSVSSVATAMQTLVGGDNQVSTYREGDDRYNVQLRVEKEFRTSTGALERLYVPSTTLGNVAVANVARFEEATGPTQIDRYNRQRQIMITANILKEQNSLSKVIEDVNKIVVDLDLPPTYATGLTGQSKEFGRAAVNFLTAALLSFIFMYMILAAQFESFVDPITILISLPMSIPFALISLMAFGENFSIIYSSVGVLVLFGIVKKNSILQIDHIKQLRAKGLPRLEAIVQGCEDRLRPILMTTAALVAGMIPLALGTGAGAGSRRSAAITVIGGQTLCLLLTLLLTPVAYSLFDDFIHSPMWGKIGRALSLRGARVRRGLQSATGLFGVLALMFVLATVAEAQTQPQNRPIALKEAIELALKNNLEVEITRNATSTAQAAFKAAQGAFDPVFRLSPGYENRRTPTASLLLSPTGTVEETVAGVNSSYVQRLPWNGTQFSAGFDNSRNTTNNPFTGLTPFYTSRFAATLAQPLLRGRETDDARTELIVRKRQAGIADLDLEQRIVDIVSRVQAGYWDLLSAQRDVIVKRDSVDYAQKQLEMNLRMIESGTLAAVERAASEAELERRKDSYLAAVELVVTLENSLKTLIASGREDAIWPQTLIPTDSEPSKTAAAETLDEAMRSAVTKRVELRQLSLQRENANDQKRLARDLTRPGLNASVSYISNGLGGVLNTTPNPITGTPQVVPPAFLGGLGTSLGNMFQYPTVQAGVTLDLNIRNRAAQGLFEQTAAQERQLRLETARIEQAVTTEVRNALQAISTARQRIAAADASARAAQEKLESELRLFGTGESTNFLVLTRQNELADSRTRAIAARLNLYKAQVNLAKATGTALEAQEISLR
jgi:HAE1 family hydrophobic/amphiphilic exporter-1